MSEDVSISEATAEVAPVEYSRIPYVIELTEYSKDDPEAEVQCDDEPSGPDIDGSERSVVIDTD